LPVGLKIVDQHREILSRLSRRDSRLVPIIGLGTEEDTDHDDAEIDRHREPVVMRDMLANAPKDHCLPPPIADS
jgi:hypothetical protein